MTIDEIRSRLATLRKTPGIGLPTEHRHHLTPEQMAEVQTAEEEIADLNRKRADIQMAVSGQMSRIYGVLKDRGHGQLYPRFRFAGSDYPVMFYNQGNPRDFYFELIPASEFIASDHGIEGDWIDGGIYCQPEGRRQEFVSQMLAALERENAE